MVVSPESRVAGTTYSVHETRERPPIVTTRLYCVNTTTIVNSLIMYHDHRVNALKTVTNISQGSVQLYYNYSTPYYNYNTPALLSNFMKMFNSLNIFIVHRVYAQNHKVNR